VNWWRRMREQFRPLQRTHPIFGKLTFMRMPDESRSYWEGQVTFGPAQKRVEVFVHADEKGPTEAHEICFNEIARHFDELWPQFDALFAKCQMRWVRKPPSAPYREVYQVTSLDIPTGLGADTEWEVGFDSTQDAEHLYTIELRGWTAVGEVRVDG
jgi:hypothetical protein